jgi:hypothetical protein
MVALPSVTGDIVVTESRGGTPTQLLSGGIGVVKRLNAKKSFTIPFDYLVPADASILRAFGLGLYGEGPFVFVDSSVRNHLGLDSSTCGLRSNASHGWVSSAGTLTVDTSTAAPTGVLTGVLKWASGTGSATLQPGSAANTADTKKAPVYLPTEAVSAAVWVKASSAKTLTLKIAGHDATGADLASVSQSISVTTSWQRVQLSAGAGNTTLAGSAFILPRLVMPSSSPPATVWIAGAQLEYADGASDFEPGWGSPRVILPDNPSRTVPQFGYSSHSLVLSEA